MLEVVLSQPIGLLALGLVSILGLILVSLLVLMSRGDTFVGAHRTAGARSRSDSGGVERPAAPTLSPAQWPEGARTCWACRGDGKMSSFERGARDYGGEERACGVCNGNGYTISKSMQMQTAEKEFDRKEVERRRMAREYDERQRAEQERRRRRDCPGCRWGVSRAYTGKYGYVPATNHVINCPYR